MQNHYLSSNPVMLARTLVPEQHIGMMNVYICVDFTSWSGQKDEPDDKHFHKCGHRPNYSPGRNAVFCSEEWGWMKALMKWGKPCSATRSSDIGC